MHAFDSLSADEIRRGCFTGMRLVPPPDLLDADLRRRIEAQRRILGWIVASVSVSALDQFTDPIATEHHVIPPGWWFSAEALGVTDARGRVYLVACGTEGSPLHYRMAAGLDHRRQGIDAQAWAIIAAHEAMHSAHNRALGFDAAAAALADPVRTPGGEIAGFAAFVRLVHQRMTGGALPEGYDDDRWPWRAPGLDGWLEGIAAAVAPFAVPPAGAERPCSEAAWLEAQRLSFSQDMRDLLAMREAAARWRARNAEAAA